MEAFLLSRFWFTVTATITMIGGTMFIMWLGEKITDKGIGNGISLIIMIGIIARLPFAIVAEFGSKVNELGGGLVMLLIEFVILFAVFMFSILLIQGTRKIPVQYAKRIVLTNSMAEFVSTSR
jgi:preprotein translocase subunit SecY